jgi:hypothetical protein
MKHYLSRAQTRAAWAVEMPAGDPTGGAAYGERRDPVSAIVSIATMVGTGGAVMAGTATLMQGLAFAGAAIGLVGNVTGNKTLSKIGMVTGLAGGVGMLAEGVLGTTIGGTMGETFGYGAGAAPVANAGPSFAADSLSQTANPAAAVQPPVVDGVMQGGAQTMPVDPGSAALTRPLDAAGPAAQNLNAGPGAGAPSLNAGPGAPAPGATAPLASTPVGADPFTATTPTGLRALPGDTGAMSPGFLDSLKAGNYMDAAKAAGTNLMDLSKSNPGAAMMLGNAASGVANWLSGKTDAEIAALEAQTGYNNAAALRIQEVIAQEKRRRANLNQSWAGVNTQIRANPNAQVTMPWAQQAAPAPAPGLIAGARPPGG